VGRLPSIELRFVISRLPGLLKSAHNGQPTAATRRRLRALALLDLTYQAAAVLLTKLGEADLAWIGAERGFQAAQQSGDPIASVRCSIR
jgi:hypothetical protein